MGHIPRRVAARPSADAWSDTELMTLAEAAALLFPSGSPITQSTLRSCYRAGKLEVVMVSRKVLVNKRAIEAMLADARMRKGG